MSICLDPIVAFLRAKFFVPLLFYTEDRGEATFQRGVDDPVDSKKFGAVWLLFLLR